MYFYIYLFTGVHKTYKLFILSIFLVFNAYTFIKIYNNYLSNSVIYLSIRACNIINNCIK